MLGTQLIGGLVSVETLFLLFIVKAWLVELAALYQLWAKKMINSAQGWYGAGLERFRRGDPEPADSA